MKKLYQVSIGIIFFLLSSSNFCMLSLPLYRRQMTILRAQRARNAVRQAYPALELPPDASRSTPGAFNALALIQQTDTEKENHEDEKSTAKFESAPAA